MKFCIAVALLTTLGQGAYSGPINYKCRGKNGYNGHLFLSEASHRTKYVDEECTQGYYGEYSCVPGYVAGRWDERTATLKLKKDSLLKIFQFAVTRADGDERFHGYVSEMVGNSPFQLSTTGSRDEDIYTVVVKNALPGSDAIELICLKSGAPEEN